MLLKLPAQRYKKIMVIRNVTQPPPLYMHDPDCVLFKFIIIGSELDGKICIAHMAIYVE